VNALQRRELADAARACGLPWEDAEGATEVSARGGAPWTLRASAPKRAPRRHFSPRDFEEPVASALAAFDALCPVAAVARAGAGWTLVLEKPLPWPLFLRCDLAAAFAPRAAQLALILRDARVVALDFDGEALWARSAG